MSRLIDITGQKFNRLIAVKRVSDLYGDKPAWLCRCDCGNSVVVSGYVLRKGRQKSCGCLMNGKVIKTNLVGEKFGRLTVLKKGTPKKQGKQNRLTWHCKCDCGNELDVVSGQLRAGYTKSCGCLFKENSHQSNFKKRTAICETCRVKFTHTKGHKLKTCSKKCHNKRIAKANRERVHESLENVLKSMIGNCRTRAIKNGIPFEISNEFLIALLNEQDRKCCKTGIPFEISPLGGLTNRSPWSVSIDQIEPGEGYTTDNVQLVCSMYNLCKNTWAHEDVLKFAKAARDYE